MKKEIAACLDRILEFDTQNEAALYLELLRAKRCEFRVLHRRKVGEKYQIRFKNSMTEIL